MAITITATLAILSWVLVFAPARPWERTGTLVVALKVQDTGVHDTTLKVGFDEVAVTRGDSTRVLSRRTQRHELSSSDAGTVRVLAHARLPVGEYESVSVALQSPGLTSTVPGATRLPGIRLPSSVIRLPVQVSIRRKELTALIVSVEEPILRTQSDAEQTWLPVVQLESRVGADFEKISEAEGTVANGTVVASRTYGMDENGMMRLNYRAPIGGQ